MPRKLKPVTKLEAALYKALPELRSPEWFEKVLNAARNRYRRVDISKLTCPICEHPVHVATDYIQQDLGKKEIDCTPNIYAFCGCTAGTPDMPTRYPEGNTNEGWRCVASFFLLEIANPGTEKHRNLMRYGVCCPEMLIKFIRAC
jgi:hypothetical protein